MKRPSLHITTLIVLTLTLGLASCEFSKGPDGRAHAYFFYVDQGDGILLVSPKGKQIVIDGGPDTSLLEHLGKTMPFFDRRIDLLVLSHPHLDHLFSFPQILEQYEVGGILMAGADYDSARYEELLTLIKEKKIPILIPDPTKTIDLGDGLILDVTWPPPVYFGQKLDDDVHDSNVVLRASFGADSILFTGDLEEEGEAHMLATGEDIQADILKIGHHGSRTSTSTGLLLAVRPTLAVISSGRDSKFGHPHQVTLDRLEHFGIPYRATAREGSIHIEMDGL